MYVNSFFWGHFWATFCATHTRSTILSLLKNLDQSRPCSSVCLVGPMISFKVHMNALDDGTRTGSQRSHSFYICSLVTVGNKIKWRTYFFFDLR